MDLRGHPEALFRKYAVPLFASHNSVCKRELHDSPPDSFGPFHSIFPVPDIYCALIPRASHFFFPFGLELVAVVTLHVQYSFIIKSFLISEATTFVPLNNDLN